MSKNGITTQKVNQIYNNNSEQEKSLNNSNEYGYRDKDKQKDKKKNVKNNKRIIVFRNKDKLMSQ